MMEMTELTPTEDVYTPEQCFITTIHGHQFHLDNPVFHIEDICWALAHNCRFNGHCYDFYSVAEHSILVAQFMDEWGTGDPLEGLLHDATEAYLSDMPAPFKQKFKELGKKDKEMDKIMRKQFGLPPEKTLECKRADIVSMFSEAYHLTPYKGKEYADPWNMRPRALEFVESHKPYCLSPKAAREAFKSAYKKLALIHPNIPEFPD